MTRYEIGNVAGASSSSGSAGYGAIRAQAARRRQAHKELRAKLCGPYGKGKREGKTSVRHTDLPLSIGCTWMYMGAISIAVTINII